MKRPPVTPIFPKNNGSITPSYLESLPIRKLDSKENMLKMGGFNAEYNMHNYHQTKQPFLIHNTPTGINCISIAQHIDTCPICSRLYDTDKTLYILAILGLLILCFLMVKRIVKL
jgi:hypothetical protein